MLLFRFHDSWYFGSAPGVRTGCRHDAFWAVDYDARYFLSRWYVIPTFFEKKFIFKLSRVVLSLMYVFKPRLLLPLANSLHSPFLVTALAP